MRTLVTDGRREVVAVSFARDFFSPAQALAKFCIRFAIVDDASQMQNSIIEFDAAWRRDGWYGMGELVRLALGQRRSQASPA